EPRCDGWDPQPQQVAHRRSARKGMHLEVVSIPVYRSSRTRNLASYSDGSPNLPTAAFRWIESTTVCGRSPDACSAVAGQHRQPDTELKQAHDPLEEHVPVGAGCRQHAGYLQNGRWHAEHT